MQTPSASGDSGAELADTGFPLRTTTFGAVALVLLGVLLLATTRRWRDARLR
ncbi:hypothetical protein ACSMXN_08885 [Jatrophihabitans sp. DSM 45814]